MKERINIASIYVLLWAVYYMQGTLYEEGSPLSQMLLVLIMIISMYCFFYANKKYSLPLYYKGLNLLLFVITIYGVLRLSKGTMMIGNYKEVPSYAYLKDHFMSLLPIYSFYVFVKKKWIREDNISFLIFIFFAVSVIFFFRIQREYAEKLGREEITNNSGYMFVQLYPLLFLCRAKQIYKFVASLIFFIFILLTMKRGAILLGSFCFFYSLYEMVKNSSKVYRGLVFIGAILVFSIGIYYISYLYDTNEYFQFRVQETIEGDSSGRDSIYGDLLKHYLYGTTVIEFLFGTGADSTLLFSANFAHNDWLELATDLGVLGILSYSFYWFQFARSIKGRHKQQYKNALIMIFVICFLRTFFSMSINDMFVACSGAIGLIFADNNSTSSKLVRYVKVRNI